MFDDLYICLYAAYRFFISVEGDYGKAKAMIEKYAVIRPVMQKALDRLSNVPVDIEPKYPLAEKAPLRK